MWRGLEDSGLPSLGDDHCFFSLREVHLAEASEEAADALKKIACSFCGKRFRTRAHVKQHENAHQGIRKFVCKVCNRTFTWAAERKVILLSSAEKGIPRTFCQSNLPVPF